MSRAYPRVFSVFRVAGGCKAIKIAKHYTDLSVGLALRFFFAPSVKNWEHWSDLRRSPSSLRAFYSHNLIISALRPGTSSSGLDPSTITPRINPGREISRLLRLNLLADIPPINVARSTQESYIGG